MAQKSLPETLVRVLLMFAFLPFVLIWYVWQKTDWKRGIKWLATAGIAVVFLITLAVNSEDAEKNDVTVSCSVQSNRIRELEDQLQAEKQKNAELMNSQKVQEKKDEKVEIPVQKDTAPIPAPIIDSTKNITPVPQPVPEPGKYVCNCAKTCPQMSSCAEAQYQLKTCGCSRRDADNDGIACDNECQ